MNCITLIGRLTKDVELRNIPNTETIVGKFSIAVTRKTNKNKTDFFNCACFGRTAENLSKYKKKGELISIVGSMHQEKYEKDGQTIYYYEVLAKEIDYISSGKNTIPSVENINYDMQIVDDQELPY